MITSESGVIEWTDVPGGSSGHVNNQLVVQIRKLGAGGWIARWCNGMQWDISDQSSHISEGPSRHFKTRVAAKRAINTRLNIGGK